MRRLGSPATRAAVAGIRRRPRQTLLIGLAVLVATVFAAGTVLFSGTMRDALLADSARTPPGASFVVDRPDDATGAGALAARLAEVPGVSAVVPAQEGELPVTVRGTTGQWRIGTDPATGPMSVRPAPEQGHAPGPGEVLLSTATAERTGLAVGDALSVSGRPYTVGGISSHGPDGGDGLLLSPADAVAFGPDLYYGSRVDVAGTPDRDALEAAAAGARVRTADEAREAEISSVSGSVTSVLAALSVFVGLALVSAAVVVGSTFRIVLGRRGRELAMLRCVGASRGQVTRSVLAEAGITGLVAGVVGAAVATGAAYAALAVMRASGTDVPALALSPGGLAGCVLLAVVATVVAALPPALAAGRVPPVVALGAADSTEAHAPRARRRMPVVAVLLASAAGIGALGASVGDSLVGLALVALSGLVAFAALVLVGPYLVAGAAALVRPLVARSGPARLAVANARRVSRRTAATTTVLALGVGLTAALLVGIDGATADARASIDRNYPSEVMVLPSSPSSSLEDPAARRAAADALAARLGERPELRVRTGATAILVDAAPGTDPMAARTAVAEATDGSGGSVIWTADTRASTEETFTIVRAVGGGLVGVTLVVAVLGVGVTLALSVAERTREIALLRALGLTRSGARGSVAAEAALAGAVGAVVGVLLGGAYGALGLQAVDMSVSAPPVGQLLVLGGGVVLVAVLASTASMRRAGRVAPATGLAGG
ncbi:FtsX-like permease family protein [Pseudonocardia nantongensis]|uniref:FtsX-like permease family protein n=1 Tax=Pseudonocardia nantongensis TaxID=1181885 RepID=UPI00397AD925